MRWTDLVSAGCAAVWAFMLWLGITLIAGVVEQQVPGYPNSGQIALYVYIPVAGLVVTIAAMVLARMTTWGRAIYPAVVIVATLAVLPTLMLFGGGI